MTILFDLNHAAHVHFIRNAYKQLSKEGYNCLVTASDKPLVYELLGEYQIPFHRMGTIGVSFIAKIFKLLVHDFKMLCYCLRHRPDVILGIVAIRGSHIGWLLGIKTIVFTDTEHATKQIAIFKPFASEIHTPNWFGTALGKKQHRYSGFHELAYLHPDNFSAREEVLDLLGVVDREPYFILRFIAWDATHDVGQSGIRLVNKRELVKRLLPHGKVFITSEYDLEEEFKQYEYNIPKSYLHDALSYCSILIGEGATTACEAAMLGVPNILINSMQWGYITYLEKEYDLLYHLTDDKSLFEKLQMLLANPNLKEDWRIKRDAFLSTQQDTTAYIVDLLKSRAR